MKNRVGIFIFGGFFMSLISSWAVPIPWSPIQLSLQSLGVSFLSILFLGQASYGILGYLVLATWGFPFLAGGQTNAYWLYSPKAGYYIGFFLASMLVGNLLERLKPSQFATNWLCLALNESTILFAGWLGLSYYLSHQKAWLVGVWPFLPGAMIKITIATLFRYKLYKGVVCLYKQKQ